jgi:hypothetical protein
MVFGTGVGGSGDPLEAGVFRRTRGGKWALALFVDNGRGGGGLVGIRPHGRDIQVSLPRYKSADPHCCPSSWAIRTYHWTGTRFRITHKSRVKNVPRSFYF